MCDTMYIHIHVHVHVHDIYIAQRGHVRAITIQQMELHTLAKEVHVHVMMYMYNVYIQTKKGNVHVHCTL